MRRWRRVDAWTMRRQVVAGVAILYGSLALPVLLAGMITELAAGRLTVRQPGPIAVAVAVTVAVLLAAVRFHLVGIYYGERGLLIRHLHRSRLLPWPEVTGFDVRPMAVLFGLEGRQQAAWVLTRDGAVETPVRARGPVRQLDGRSGPA
ncbi:hypothetical protein ONA70_34205, partial [Micromonospora yasonensis]|uniref:hypothetical protein n=1 Tax=Micromonospora yasonensis TaxID=1128667 RepID=UPI0022317393